MRGTTFTKGKMNYFGSFSQQRTWAPLAQGAAGGLGARVTDFSLRQRSRNNERQADAMYPAAATHRAFHG